MLTVEGTEQSRDQKSKVMNQSEEFIVLTECDSYNVIVVLLTLCCWMSFIILLEMENSEGDSSVCYGEIIIISYTDTALKDI